MEDSRGNVVAGAIKQGQQMFKRQKRQILLINVKINNKCSDI